MLELVVPGLGQAGVKPQQGEGAEHILVKCLIIAVDVMGHLNVHNGTINRLSTTVSPIEHQQCSSQQLPDALQLAELKRSCFAG